ncbi:MAG: RHS repeat-associated core domain-containing protein, partial [Bacilli bacterium]|nr:RHS repeat-associated core domain-containing protein [Bacilli bacterium]
KIICYLDEGSYSINKSFSYFINGFDIILGRVKEGYSTSTTLGEEKEIEELHGSICDLIITNNAIYDVDGLKNKIQKVIKETKTDDLGRLIKEEIKDNNLSYVQEYTYLRRSGSEQYTSFLVETTKQLINNAFIKEIKYSYDNLKRVTRVQEKYNETSSFEEVEKYTYDKRGYLVGDNDRTYEYDDNGNITKNGSETLHYQTIVVDGVTKNTDILKEINNSSVSSVSYFSSLPLFPDSYKQMELTYEGKNLIGVYFPSSREGFAYSYNHEGLRIKRSGNRSGTVTYSYSGNKLILQQSSSLKLEFLYDEKDNLYGFIKNNNERYYYIRDALGNILGIINQNGQIVVQYSYTSYGVCSISGNTSLGNENPFRYKGYYYYDVETSLYYITTRYYDPEIGRWISPDCVCYLNSTSINGLNLYSYCYNDPINYIDSSGCYPVRIQVGRLTICFHSPHGNGHNAQHHIHIKKGNVKVASRNYDGSVHDQKYGKNYVPSKEVYNALLEHGWDWYGNKFSLFDFSGLYRKEFPLQQSGYSLEQFPVTNTGSSVEVFPSLNNGFVLETFPQVTPDTPYYNPSPLTNQEKQILVVTAIVTVAVVAIALIPATGGGSAVLLLV